MSSSRNFLLRYAPDCAFSSRKITPPSHTLPPLCRYAPSQRLRPPNVLAHYATARCPPNALTHGTPLLRLVSPRVSLSTFRAKIRTNILRSHTLFPVHRFEVQINRKNANISDIYHIFYAFNSRSQIYTFLKGRTFVSINMMSLS